MAASLFKQISGQTTQTSSPESAPEDKTQNINEPVRAIPYKFENKFQLYMTHLGNYKIKQKMSYLLMPYFMIKINCNLVPRFGYETIVVGDENEDVDRAKENAFRKAYYVIRAKYKEEVLELERSYFEDEYQY